MNVEGSWWGPGEGRDLSCIDYAQRGHDEREVARFSYDEMVWGRALS